MKKTMIWAFAALSAFACTRSEGIDDGRKPVVDDRVTVYASLGIAALSDTGSGRSGGVADVREEAIDNVWVFQFGTDPGSGDNARKLVVPPFYIDEEMIAEATTAAGGGNALIPIPLIESLGEQHMVVFAANVGGEYSWNMSVTSGSESTYADLLGRYSTIALHTDATGGTKKNLVMTGRVYSAIDPAIVLDETPDGDIDAGIPLTRSLAKIRLDLSVAAPTATENYKVISVQLRNVSNRIDLFDAAKTFDTLYPAQPTTIDFPADVDEAAGLVTNGGAATEFLWYVPRNTRGQSDSMSPKTKHTFAPAGATYIEIVAVNTLDANKSYIYRIYPGANNVNDYTVVPNKSYTIGLEIAGKGELSDSRIENYSDVTLDGANNSFILNPPTTSAIGPRTFHIPVTQVNRYWRPTWPGYGGLGCDILGPDDEWQVDLLWQDAAGIVRAAGQDADKYVILEKASGKGGDDYFSVTVPAAAMNGNCVIALRKKDVSDVVVDEVLWSWHLWITDYAPDQSRNFSVAGHTYTYPVSGGQVERYGGTLWGYSGTAADNWNDYDYAVTTPTPAAPYARSFMMDRAVGALSTAYVAGTARGGGLKYQFGRKDPFANNHALYRIDGTALTTAATAGFAAQRWTSTNANNTAKPAGVVVPTAVQNPLVHYSVSSDWAGLNEAAYLWQDAHPDVRYANATASDLAAGTGRFGKSIYDPCPAGWKMPFNGTWDDFRQTVTANNASRGLAFSSGISYWPGLASDPVDGRVVFPALGYRASSNGSVSAPGTGGYYWSSTASNATTGYYLYFLSGSISPNYGGVRAASFPIRCISE